mgnify:CR=1 FL=1|tara:strand:+ start:26545 stop:27396 length:852 start_codon:yes stop_codon:yes gene_type:complete
MRTIIARNAHQALAESCYQLDTFGVTDADGGKVMPIPTTTTILAPLERVPSYADLDPFALLMNAAEELAEGRFPHVVDGAKALKANPDTRVTLTNEGCDSIGSILVQVDMDGKVMMLASSANTTVMADPADLVYLSMVLELMASVSGREAGCLWSTNMRPHSNPNDARVHRIAQFAPQPPAQFEDPYSLGKVTNTIPLLSIPVNRYMRELVQFFGGAYDTVDYIDPFIQHVLAPAHRANRLYHGDAAVPVVQRAIGEIAAQDWMQACQHWVTSTTTPCTPPIE